MAVWLGGCFLPPLFSEHAPDSVAGGGTQHLWSLAVEEHFYLLWPGLLAWIGARRSRDWATRLALLVGSWRMVESQMATPLFPATFTRFPDLRLDALLWGCAVAFFLNDAHQREKLAKQLRFGVWIGMAGLAGLCILYFSPLTSLIVATLIPVLLAGTVLHPRWLLSRFLDWAPVAWLGRISYSLYLWQGMFLDCRLGASGGVVASVAGQPAAERVSRCAKSLSWGRSRSFASARGLRRYAQRSRVQCNQFRSTTTPKVPLLHADSYSSERSHNPKAGRAGHGVISRLFASLKMAAALPH